ncbi:GDSL-type esterase/lipase family protein [Schleiferiaceae bacterium]|nr:GDSL-type esterase/lipase family protein [Schleiferiaceae bacterium]
MKQGVAILFIMFTLALQGQESLGALSLKYPFLDTTKQSLQYFGSDDALKHFFEKLDRAIFEGQGKVNVVHMGGSHVQGGTLSHTMRMNLAQLAPELNVERGFFFPHRLANTNMPGNIYVKKIGTWEGCRNSIPRNNCPWGFSGIDAITRDKDAGFVVQSFSGPGEAYAFRELRVFEHYRSNTMVPICTPAPDSTYIDTIAGVRCWFFNVLVDSIAVTFNAPAEGEHQYTLQGLQMVRDEPGLIYHALGVNGAATKSFLRSENFIEQGAYVAPDLVIFGLGINDAYKPDSDWHPEEYKARYDTLVDWFRTINPDCAFIFMTNNDSYYKRRTPNKHALDVVRVMEELSKEHDAALWDLFGVMGGLNSIVLWEEHRLAKSDKIHFTRAGYRLNSDLLFWAFWEAYEQHLKTLAP